MDSDRSGDGTVLLKRSANRRPSLVGVDGTFHEVATVLGIWILAIFVGVHTLSSMRTILVPLFWAFFLMMGLVPATDYLEHLLCVCCGVMVCNPKTSVAPSVSDYKECGNEGGERTEEEESALEEEASCTQFIIRTVAVLLVVVMFLGLVTLFFLMIYVSALHMQENFAYYQEGMKRLGTRFDHITKVVSKVVPHSVMDNMTSKALTGVEDVLSAALSYILEGVTDTLVQGLMMLLYMLFWLCQPMHVSQNVSLLFKQYIMLKALASAGYALCVWLLLHSLGIDLAIVFGLITFLFNFVPEVGPFLAVMLPIPVVLFDSRIDHPGITLGCCLGGNLILKCVWANIIEVKLVERQREMRMHPVVILFFVAFFGWLWGPTGMLLSVPAVAVLKASMHLFPKRYRDPILIALEGDRHAPQRYTKWRMDSLSEESRNSPVNSPQKRAEPMV